MGNEYITHVRYRILKNLLKHLLSFYRQEKCKGKFIFFVSGLATVVYLVFGPGRGWGGGGGGERSLWRLNRLLANIKRKHWSLICLTPSRKCG